MGVKWKLRLLCLILAGLILAFPLMLYECVIGFPRVIDRQLVYRRTSWWSSGLGDPIPRIRGTVYYYYEDAQGREVRHGPYQQLNADGTVRTQGSYRHGRYHGTWKYYDSKGAKIGEGVWAAGKLVSGTDGVTVIKGVAPTETQPKP